MSLKKYKEKRDFKKTPEPSGKETKSQGPLRFVIQKHEATRLHYDFRLEMGGVMKSWAIPKGPQADPEIKRLAMMTEDHPIEYNEFEGIIPKGQYGGGTVMIWDEGYFVPIAAEKIEDSEKIALQMLEKGDLKFVIKGKKIKGEYALVKTHREGEDNAWLLIKKKDDFANEKDLTLEDKSVTTGRSMEEIAKGAKEKGEIWNSNKDIDLDEAKRSPMPREIKPMLATLTDKPFDKKGWIFEIKWDGYRAISEIDQGKVEIYSRNNLSFNKVFSPIVKNLEKSPHQMILDGEMVILDENGKPSFSLMQNYKKTGKGTLVYYVFDILYLDGYSLMELPLMKRKEILNQVVPTQSNILLSGYFEEKGIDFFETAKKQGLEGIIAKKGDSKYMPKIRSVGWLKIKSQKRQEAIICGFTEPKGSRKHLGALILGAYKGNELTYIGHTGGKISDQALKDLRIKLEKIEVSKSPFEEQVPTNSPAHWVKPVYICEVSFQEWTPEGHLRIPIFEGLREDKDPKEVTIEKPVEKKVVLKKEEKEIENDLGVKVSNKDKVLWPKEKYTKGDLIDYYEKISDTILPYLIDRPESLNRHPNGIDEKSFFQKNMEGKLPDFVETYVVQSDSEERDVNYLVCQNKETLIYMANLGCIEINPWFSRIKHLDKPDFMAIDLDPEEISFEYVIKTANEVRKLFQELNIKSYPKTSGATGMHIYVPMEAKYTFDQVKQFAEIMANIINSRIPDYTSVIRDPKKRQKRVYLDYLQNRRGQTLAAPYSLRPKPGATVSTPLEWDEVNEDLDPKKYNINSIFTRLEKTGDIFKPVLNEGIDLKKSLLKLTEIYTKS